MSRTTARLEQLLRLHPEDQERLRPYVDRAKRYSNECGCSMGGAFLVAALVSVLAYDLRAGRLDGAGPVITILIQAMLVLVAGMLGKLVGVAVARIRLAVMYRELAVRHPVGGG
jgi:hypothetical protein